MGRIGINWINVREFNPLGTVSTGEVDVVELSFAEVDFIALEEDILELCRIVRDDTGVGYTVHAPYQNSPVERLRVNLAERCSLKVVERALELAGRIGAEGVVVHAGDAVCRHALKNAVRNLRAIDRLAGEYGMYVAVENVFSEGVARRVGELPDELLRLCELACRWNLGANIDVGHAHISSVLHGVELESYFEVLGDRVMHLHLHNNHGTEGEPWDEHLPLTTGSIDYSRLGGCLRAETAVLEVKRGAPRDISLSLELLRRGGAGVRRIAV
ncbi:MAG: sugar phosphate isomerase/epimerase [Euryarchaeota archaeon]|nr:sugar phosphate isomerase/epimerase [Euryarchaeota archaeon]